MKKEIGSLCLYLFPYYVGINFMESPGCFPEDFKRFTNLCNNTWYMDNESKLLRVVKGQNKVHNKI